MPLDAIIVRGAREPPVCHSERQARRQAGESEESRRVRVRYDTTSPRLLVRLRRTQGDRPEP